MIIVQAVVIYLVAYLAGLLCFGALNLVMEVDVFKDSAIAAFGAAAWTLLAAFMVGWSQRGNGV